MINLDAIGERFRLVPMNPLGVPGVGGELKNDA
jgi:hypothetical protein